MDKVLVLNADYTPLNVTSVYRGFNLVVKGKAEILKSGEKPIVTETKEYSRPLIIRLLNYVKYRIHKLKINRHRIFRRDGYKCGMKMIQKPFEPSFFSDVINPNIESVWNEFQKNFF